MPNFILSTCGTSLLTNKTSNEIRSIITKYSNETQWHHLPEPTALEIQHHIECRKNLLLNETDTNVIKSLSAELNGLLTFHNSIANDNQTNQDIYYLLATDTLFGRATAEIIASWLNKKGLNAQIITENGLRTAQLREFRQALSSLAKKLVENFESYKHSGYKIYINLTGGFKSLNGFLQALASLYADETFYLFEGSNELMFIPKLPFRLEAESLIEQNLTAFRRLSNDLQINPTTASQIPDVLLFEVDDHLMLSEWGELLWQSHKAQIYQKFLPSISSKIIYTPEFSDSVKHLPINLIPKLNSTIEQLAVYAESNGKINLRSLDAKPLKEKQYRDKDMWECDIEGNNYRIFMIKADTDFILQKAGQALHKSNTKI